MKAKNIIIIMIVLGAILIPALAYDYANGVYCEKKYIPWVGGVYMCDDGRFYTTYSQMDNYYTSVIDPPLEEILPEYTYVIGSPSETLSGRLN